MGVKKERGSAILEFAVGASTFVFFFTGVFQFGYTFYAYSKLENATRAGARYAAMSVYRNDTPTVNSSPSSTLVDEVRNVTVYGDPAGSGGGTRDAVVNGLTTSNVNVSVSFANSVPATVSVSISGLRVNGLFGTWQANGKPEATFQFVGRYAPPIT
jgi:Flp pilus assembly protein TadG